MANLIVFCILAVVILGSAIMSVLTKRIMRSATFLLFVLFGIAGIYFLLDYTFLGAVQISIYAGGVTMIYIFAIQLVSKRTLQGLVEQSGLKRLSIKYHWFCSDGGSVVEKQLNVGDAFYYRYRITHAANWNRSVGE